MKKEIIQLLKDFYSDRDRYNQHASPFESTMEIYEKHAERIKERMHEIIAETMRDVNNSGGQLNYLTDEIEKLLEKYNEFLIKNNYVDADIYAEEPTAIDRFLGRKL